VSKHGIFALSEGLFMHLKQVRSKVGVSVVLAGAMKTRIVDAERNRPAALRNNPGNEVEFSAEAEAFSKRMKRLVESGMSPEEVANIVFDGVRGDKFYVYTHPQMLKPMLRAHLEAILEERSPGRIVPP
jgi:short-subunit dehydrogenase